MGLKAGTTNQLSQGQATGSMAKAIEDAFLTEWKAVKGADNEPKMTEDMRLIFAAVAQGVINHLVANENAFQISISGGNHNHNSGNNGSHTHSVSDVTVNIDTE